VDRLHEQQKSLEDDIAITKKKMEAQQLETFEAQKRVQAANQEVEVRCTYFQIVGIAFVVYVNIFPLLIKFLRETLSQEKIQLMALSDKSSLVFLFPYF
jgi:hypothetical protein